MWDREVIELGMERRGSEEMVKEKILSLELMSIMRMKKVVNIIMCKVEAFKIFTVPVNIFEDDEKRKEIFREEKNVVMTDPK